MAAEARLRKAESIVESINFNDRIANLKVHSLLGPFWLLQAVLAELHAFPTR